MKIRGVSVFYNKNGAVIAHTLFLYLLFLENLYSHIIDSGVVKDYDATVGTRFDMNAAILAEFVVAAAEIVAYGLNCGMEFVSDAVGGTVR